jgi:cysteine desulfurase
MFPEVTEAMHAWLSREFGNPSSLYAEGRRAKEHIDAAREIISSALGCLFGEVLFTSSGTEAANTALIGLALANKDPSRKKILVGASEHHCVLHTREALECLGYRVELIPVDQEARVNLEQYERMLSEEVLLVSIMHANNELGSINPIRILTEKAHRQGILFHCDAVQTFMMPLSPSQPHWSVQDLDVDLLSISAHKIHGPKGVGGIYIRSGVKLKPLINGGGQEREMRGGTENVAGIIGFAKAVEVLSKHDSIWQKKFEVRQRFLDALKKKSEVPFICSIQDWERTLPGHAHLRFPGISAESMLILLDRMGVCASSGAACSSGSLEPSHVLLACGYSKQEAKKGLRFTFGLTTTFEEAETAAHRLATAAQKISGKARAHSPAS